jgi:hypothetical protein
MGHQLGQFLVVQHEEIAGLQAQESAALSSVPPSVLHIVQSQTTSKPNFPTYLAMYHVLNSANSSIEAPRRNRLLLPPFCGIILPLGSAEGGAM